MRPVLIQATLQPVTSAALHSLALKLIDDDDDGRPNNEARNTA